MSSLAAARKLTPNQQARRHRILEAARTLVAKHGYDGMIMRDVANLARVSPTTLYNLYNTKDELLLEALTEGVTEGFGRTAEQAPKLGFERLIAQTHQSVNETREAPAYAKAITQALLRAGPGDQIVEVLINRSVRAVVSSLRAMRELDQLQNDTNIDELAIAIVGSFWSNYMLWSKDIVSIDRLEQQIRRGYLANLLPASKGAISAQIQRLLEELQP
jgi:AcrR family transcriptional regulator